VRTALTEGEILRAVRDYLRVEGWLVIRNQQGLGSYKGLPDLTAIRAGQVVWVELKTPRGHLSEDQERFRADIEQHGGRWLLARSVEDVEFLARPDIRRLPLGGARVLS
jgi:Holliday junction resolvase